MTDERLDRIRRPARIFAGMTAVDFIAVFVTNVVWPSAVLPLVVGWCLSWLTAVAFVQFDGARRPRNPSSEGSV